MYMSISWNYGGIVCMQKQSNTIVKFSIYNITSPYSSKSYAHGFQIKNPKNNTQKIHVIKVYLSLPYPWIKTWYSEGKIYGCFLKWWVFPFHTSKLSFLVGKPHGFVGETLPELGLPGSAFEHVASITEVQHLSPR